MMVIYKEKQHTHIHTSWVAQKKKIAEPLSSKYQREELK